MNGEASHSFASERPHQSDQQTQGNKSGENADAEPSPAAGARQPKRAQRLVFDESGADPGCQQHATRRYRFTGEQVQRVPILGVQKMPDQGARGNDGRQK